jgi:hypothetical protein
MYGKGKVSYVETAVFYRESISVGLPLMCEIK